jgi:hypothetical protein
MGPPVMKLSCNIRYRSYVPGLRAESLSLTSLGMAGRVNCPTRSPERSLRGPVRGGMKMVAFALAIPVKTLLIFSIVELISLTPILLIHFILYCIVLYCIVLYCIVNKRFICSYLLIWFDLFSSPCVCAIQRRQYGSERLTRKKSRFHFIYLEQNQPYCRKKNANLRFRVVKKKGFLIAQVTYEHCISSL